MEEGGRGFKTSHSPRLGVARIMLLGSVTVCPMVLSNMSIGRKEGEIDYQRECG